MKKILFCLIAVGFIYTSSFSQSPEKYGEQISADTLKSYLRVLTADSLEGRETGQVGQKRAARYISNVFSKNSLKPKGLDGYYQPYPISIQWPSGTTIKSN